MKKALPGISVIVPTLNASRTLKLCLQSIRDQKYKGFLEIIIADGGSNDKTLEIAHKYKAKIIFNKLRTGEAGKAVGAKSAKGEILVFIDSDNIIPARGWFEKMIKPFIEDKKIIASEPLYFTYRKQDHWLTRYFALLGMGDPLSLFIGNFDRFSYITNSWTKLHLESEAKNGYIVLKLKEQMPTIGANGFFIRKKALGEYLIKDYLFDIDVLKFLAQKQTVKVAKVKVGIVHLFSGNIATFIRKQRRRIRDFLFFQKKGIRVKEKNRSYIFLGIVKFSLSTVLILPVLIQAFIGYLRKRDNAWFFHPLACWITLICYSFETFRGLFIRQEFSRRKWSQ